MDYDLNYDLGYPNHMLGFNMGIGSSSLTDFLARCGTGQPQLLSYIGFLYLAIDGSFPYIS